MPPHEEAGYPRAVTSPTRAPRRPRATAPEPALETVAGVAASSSPAGSEPAIARPGWDPDGGRGDIHELLVAAVAEAARLLDADGAMVYLVDPTTGHLRFAHDAGIRSRRSRAWVRSLDLPIGVGIFGRAVAERAVVLTRDYLADTAFDHAPEADRVVNDLGIRSMVAAPLTAGDTVFGALGTFSSREDAFSPAQIALVRALADHAASAMHNARLIEALDASRTELAKRAEVERSLREIGARISAAADFPAVVQLAVDEAARLLDADGARIELVDPETGALLGAYASGALDSSLGIEIEPDGHQPNHYGVAGEAVLTGRPFWTGDYAKDTRFRRLPSVDRHLDSIGIRSVMAAPLADEKGRFGALIVSTVRPDAWGASDAGLLMTIADQAAITIRTTRLIEELDRSRDALGQRAEAEQALREIAARITALREPGEILRDVVTQAGRLVHADGVILDLLDPTTGNLHWAMDDGLSASFSDEERANLWISIGVGATGTAVAEGRVIVADGDLALQFPPSPGSTEFYERTGFHSMIAAPISGEIGPLGVIEVYAKETGAFGEADAGLVGALAGQAAIAITNARLIEELDRSRGELARTADAERTLREIAGRVSATHDQGEILEAVIDACVRLLGATGAMIDLLGDATMAEAWTSREAGERAVTNIRLLDDVTLEPGAGVSGRALRTRQVEWTGGYLEDDRFEHDESRDAFVREMGIRSVIAAPLIDHEILVGAITVYGDRADAFDEADAGLLAALADQAAIAITNARLIKELERSQAAVARRADTERALRDITARIAALREPDVILHRVVEEARRLLGTDGAHLTRLDEDGTFLVPVVVTGATDPETQAWLLDMEFPLGGGINGLAAAHGEPVWTSDYTADPRIPHEGNDDEVAARLGLCGMAAAPLRAPGGEVIGTLAISSATPRGFEPEELDLLQGLADQAAIAITNSTLLTRLTESEDRYRFLVENSPDVVFSTDAEGNFTFMSDAMERMSGWKPDEVTGGHFSRVVDPASHPEAMQRWTALVADPAIEQVAHIDLLSPDGRLIPVEVSAIGIVDDDGAFVGIHGSTRDISERARLERELRESEERYRYLVASSPDLVWLTDAAGTFTFLSDATRTMLGVEPGELIGRHYAEIFAPAARRDATIRFRWLARHPSAVHRMRLPFRHADGHDVLVEINGTGMSANGRFIGAHGAARDVSERDRLERDLRRQAGELAAGEERAHLARELHDSVTQALFSMTLVSRSVELLLDRDPQAARGQLGQLRDLQREALAEMRALIFELRPGNLEQDGLARALRTHTAALQGRIGLPIMVESALDERLPLAIEEVLYRIAQEALHNVVKHAGARQVRLEVGRTASGVRLQVQDDGKGFDPARVPDGHLGLAGMRARADKIGARFSVWSVPGEGTRIEVLVPEAAIAAGGSAPTFADPSSIRDA
jgi:PAS domain S-box-containing protein